MGGGEYDPSDMNIYVPLEQKTFSNMQLPSLYTLELPNLRRLTNKPIQDNLAWTVVLVKIPTDKPKFDGKSKEDSTTHITIFHIWCVSNLLLDDRICLCLFPHTLTGNASKWFIEFPTAWFNNFNALEMAFLTRLKHLVQYKMGTKLLTLLWITMPPTFFITFMSGSVSNDMLRTQVMILSWMISLLHNYFDPLLTIFIWLG